MTSTKTIRTLIVDDEPLARRRIRRMLARHPDVDVIGECANGREAIAAIREQHPALVFLDVQMPEVDGFAVLERISAEAMPLIIFVTAYDQYALRAFDVYALDYLLKPFDRRRFDQALQRAKSRLFNERSDVSERALLHGVLEALVRLLGGEHLAHALPDLGSFRHVHLLAGCLPRAAQPQTAFLSGVWKPPSPTIINLSR